MEARLILLAGLPIWVALSSMVTAWLYIQDKNAAATADRQRVSERTLLLWSLVGGWPGGWIAGRWLLQKTKKLSYRAAFILCAIVNFAALFGVVWKLIK